MPLWWLRAISAGISLISGFIIALKPEMTWIDIWVFTGTTMIIEGMLDAAAMVCRMRKEV